MSDVFYIVHSKTAPTNHQISVIAESPVGVAALAELSMMPQVGLDAVAGLALLSLLCLNGVNVHCFKGI